MLSNKIAENLYHEADNRVEAQLLNDQRYVKINEEIREKYNEIKSLIPEEKRKVLLSLESSFNAREAMTTKEHYCNGFKDGAKLILELLSNK